MSLTVLQTLETLVPETWESGKKKHHTERKQKGRGLCIARKDCFDSPALVPCIRCQTSCYVLCNSGNKK